MYVIIGIIAAIVLIGLVILLLWKLFTSIKDAREFKNFQKESQNAKWQAVRPVFVIKLKFLSFNSGMFVVYFAMASPV